MITIKSVKSAPERGLPSGYHELIGIDFEKLFSIISSKGVYRKATGFYVYNSIGIFKDVNVDGSVLYRISIIGKDVDCYSDFVFVDDYIFGKYKEIVDIIEETMVI